MEKRELLLRRLEEIGKSLKNSGGALALLGLGSCGKDRDRLDSYSDLDFFVITKSGCKKRFIDSVDWLTSIGPADFYFKNTADGYKLLYNDGVYCEFAVFEENELESQTFSEGVVVWKEEGFDETKCKPKKRGTPWKAENLDWAIGEVLTCVYVGLNRFARGEKLCGTRFIQSYAVDILIASSDFISEDKKGNGDEFQNERRYESRYPDIAEYLPKMIQGYERCPESAIEIVKFVESFYKVNSGIKKVIFELAEELKSR